MVHGGLDDTREFLLIDRVLASFVRTPREQSDEAEQDDADRRLLRDRTEMPKRCFMTAVLPSVRPWSSRPMSHRRIRRPP